MNKSIQMLRDEVNSLRSQVVLKSDVDSMGQLYNTPPVLTNQFDVEKSIDKSLTLTADDTVQTPAKPSETGKEQKLTIDKLTSVIPPSGFISDPFKGAKQKTSTPLNGKLESTDFQDLTPIQLSSKFEQDLHFQSKKKGHSEKKSAGNEKYTSASASAPITSHDKPSVMGSLTPIEPSRGRKTKKSKRNRSPSSSSSSDDTMSRWTRKSRSRSRSNSPQVKKMPVFKGTESPNWESFIYQFERVAAHRGWSSNKKAFRLLDCLGDVALEYARKVNQNGDFKELKRQLKQRFSRKEVPILARRQLPFTRQLENENVEEFSQRVYFLALDGYESCEGNMIEEIAIETFLRGCRDKEAAMKAMDREPTTLQKAVKYVKTAIANHRALYGTRGSSKVVFYSQRHVSFSSREGSPAGEPSDRRADSKLSKEDNNHSLDKQILHLTTLVEKLTTTVQQSFGRNWSSSPLSKGRFFERSQSPSQSPARGQHFLSPNKRGNNTSDEAKIPMKGDLNRKGSSQ
jgi:hypothetical protein